MNHETKQAIMALPIVILTGFCLALAGSQGSTNVAGMPIFALCVVVAFLIQWIAFIPAFLKQTESFYDLTGSITFLTVILLALWLSPALDVRSWLLAVVISIWAIRLGSFLFTRIRIAGEDRRFREIKKSFFRFLLAWTLQGLWITFSLAAALAAITSTLRVEMDAFAVIGFLIWLTGFLTEVIADGQKRAFTANPTNKDKFIQTGLWSWSRHPNYFGEIVLWIGITIIAFPVLHGWQWATLLSPVFITLLLTKISGIPLLEARAAEKWGGQPAFEKYKAGTSLLIPLPPSKNKDLV